MFSSFARLCFPESRKWLPKIKILSSNDEKDKHGHTDDSYTKPIDAPNATGNYNDNDGFLNASLSLIENEIFYSEPKVNDDHRIIEVALKYLKY